MTLETLTLASSLLMASSSLPGDGCSASKPAASPETVALAAMAEKDIVDTAVAAGSFKTLAAALEAAGLVETLKGKGPFTVFAPTDEAFAKLPKGTVETLLKPENKQKLIGLLTYHVAEGSVMSDQVVKLTTVPTVNGQRADIVVKGTKVMVDSAQVITPDIACTNGVIHVIDAVIMPIGKNIAEVASDAGSFQTLLAAAKAAGLVEALTGAEPYTVFAPTDEAFNAVGADTVASLLKPENKQKLTDILKYHIVKGRVYSDQVVKMNAAPTLLGKNAAISSKDGTVMIDRARVTAVDIEASNGVIHVIDAVIMPPAGR